MNIEGLVVKHRIKEDNRIALKKRVVSVVKENVIEHEHKSKKNKKLSPKEESSRSKQNFKESASTMTRWVIRLWIADCLRRTERQMSWKTSLKMFQTLTSQ